MHHSIRTAGAAIVALAAMSAAASAQTYAYSDQRGYPASIFEEVAPDRSYRSAPRYETTVSADESAVTELPAHLKRQMVAYSGRETAGTIVIDTANTYLYYVLGNGRALRYGIGVGREGFTWAGTQNVTKKAEWPDWTPPAEMIARQPYLPRFMAGGPGNPMGARAMYLGSSIYRIHGTNQPHTIGSKVSSGCIRLTNEDVADLYSRVNVGTKVVVLPDAGRRAPANVARAPQAQDDEDGSLSYARATMQRPVSSANINRSRIY